MHLSSFGDTPVAFFITVLKYLLSENPDFSEIEFDADKAAAKAAKKLAKERKRKRRALEGQAEQQRRDLETLEKYRLKYEQQKARKARSN